MTPLEFGQALPLLMGALLVFAFTKGYIVPASALERRYVTVRLREPTDRLGPMNALNNVLLGLIAFLAIWIVAGGLSV